MDKTEERLATIVERLVSFPTVASNPRDITSCIDWVRARVLMHSPRLDVRTFTSHEKPSVLFTAGKVPPRVLFCGHLDVVEAQRQHFRASAIDETHMQGRGTADMKGPIAALIDIMATEPLSGVGLLLTTDEEIGGEDGTNHVLQQVGWRPEVVVLPDGGANMRLVTEQKGLLRLGLVAKGVAAHASRPWLGDNPIDHIYDSYKSLLQAYPVPVAEDDWRVSIAMTGIHAGVAPNSVPWHAEATLDIRYPASPLMPVSTLFAYIQRHLGRYKVAAHIISQGEGFQLDALSPFVQRLQEVSQVVRQEPLPLMREAGASDARFFAAEHVPVLMFQPECAGWHGDDEWIDMQSLATFRALCIGFARSLLGRDRAPVCTRMAPRKVAHPPMLKREVAS